MKYSVVIPCFNYAARLPGAIDSALAGPPGELEVLVVDDGSTDGTADAVGPYLEGGRVSLLQQPNRGAAAARNAGAARAGGEWLLFLDADDRLLPGAFERFEAALARQPLADFVLGGHYTVEHGARTLSATSLVPLGARPLNFRALLRKRLGLATGAALVRRRVTEALRFPEQLRLNEDLVFFAQMLALFDGVSLGEPVLEVHRHSGSLRHDAAALPPVEVTVDALFDPRVLPVELSGLRREFLASRWLSRFRTLYRAGRRAEARAAYRAALRARPSSIFRLSYLSKYVRSFLR